VLLAVVVVVAPLMATAQAEVHLVLILFLAGTDSSAAGYTPLGAAVGQLLLARMAVGPQAATAVLV
jgi:hypothetical protein